jgi:hypothetical protein
MWYLSFWGWLILLNMMFSSSIYFPANDILSFFFCFFKVLGFEFRTLCLLGRCSTAWAMPLHSLLELSSTHLCIYSTFSLSAYVLMGTLADSTTWVLWVVLHLIWLCRYLYCATFLWVYVLRSVIAGSYDSSILSFLKNLYTDFHSGCTNLLPPNKGSFFLHSCQHVLLFIFLMIGILCLCVLTSICFEVILLENCWNESNTRNTCNLAQSYIHLLTNK